MADNQPERRADADRRQGDGARRGYAARAGEGAHQAQRRAGSAAGSAAVGPGRQGLHVRDRGGRDEARRPLLRAIAAHRLPPHVRAGLDEGCPSCSAIADGFEASALHLEARDVSLVAISGRRSIGCSPTATAWGGRSRAASSLGSDFNYDFHVTIDPDVGAGRVELRDQGGLEASDVDWKDWDSEQPAVRGSIRDGGQMFHAYSAFARGLDALWGAYPWLDQERAAQPPERERASGGACTTSTTTGDARR